MPHIHTLQMLAFALIGGRFIVRWCVRVRVCVLSFSTILALSLSQYTISSTHSSFLVQLICLFSLSQGKERYTIKKEMGVPS